MQAEAIESDAKETFVFKRPSLYPKQFEAFYTPARYSLIESNTKGGKTSGGITWLLEQALAGKPGRKKSIW